MLAAPAHSVAHIIGIITAIAAAAPPSVLAHLLVMHMVSVAMQLARTQLIKGQHIASFKHAAASVVLLVHTHEAHIMGTPLAAVIVVHSAAVSAPPASALAPPPPPPLPAVPPPAPAVLLLPPEPASVPALVVFLLQPTLPSATTSRPHPINDKDRFIRNPPKSPACAGSQLTAGT
jgi:hypothetical protein